MYRMKMLKILIEGLQHPGVPEWMICAQPRDAVLLTNSRSHSVWSTF
jgi:hypothetical protein